jgi:lipoprotein-releasing system ATP-binding protein
LLMADEVILGVESLTKIYRSGEEEIVVLRDVNFAVREGEFIALVGESGAGKSTLLHLIAALDTPTRGAVYFFREMVGSYSTRERSRYRNKRIGFVWQMQYLLPEFSAAENVMMPSLIGGGDSEVAQSRAAELLAEVGLAHVAGRQVGELSGGEQQRVALARALVNRPSLLLADEPTGNLDSRSAERVFRLLEKLHRGHGLTSVLATHNPDLAQRADRIFRLADGQLIETTVPEVR